jgi:general secretion pathway protein K
MSRAHSQQGAALVLVMWLVAAMAITVGGALALARDEVNLASARLGEAQAFVIGKGIARLAVLDRARARTATNNDGEVDEAALTRVFKAQYELDGFRIAATVYPASGFVSIAEADPEVWQQLLSGMGALDEGSAAALAQQIVETELEATSAGSGPRGSFQFYSRHRQVRAGVYVEQLLGVEGMNRAVYDRIRPSISPFNVGSGVDAAVAPPDMRAAFGNATEEDSALDSSPNPDAAAASGYYCVEIEVSTSPSEGFVQRIWVESRGSDEFSAVRLARVEKPRHKTGGHSR